MGHVLEETGLGRIRYAGPFVGRRQVSDQLLVPCLRALQRADVQQQEADQQQYGQVEDAIAALPCLHAPDVAGKANKTVDVIAHQGASEEYHDIKYPLNHSKPSPHAES